MGFRSLMLVLLAVILSCVSVLAQDFEKVSPYRNYGQPVCRGAESFENSFPPVGWTIDTPSGHTGNNTWFQSDISALSGQYCAAVFYDEGLVAQDCQFSFSAPITVIKDHLGFSVATSYYWMVVQGNCDLIVLVNGNQIWNLAAVYTIPNWVYREYSLDLSSYLGESVEITFQYVGLDGAAVHLDAVIINDGTAYPYPPDNNDCIGALVLEPGSTEFSGDMLFATNNFVTSGVNGCDSNAGDGVDVVYSLTLNENAVFESIIFSEQDSGLYLVTDCEDPLNSCVAGINASGAGFPEALIYSNGTGVPQELFFIIEAFGVGGEFECVVSFEGPVDSESTSFGSIKAMYR